MLAQVREVLSRAGKHDRRGCAPVANRAATDGLTNPVSFRLKSGSRFLDLACSATIQGNIGDHLGNVSCMGNFGKRILVFAIALMLAACGSVVRTNVTTFYDLPTQWKGRTIAVLPYKEQQSQSLEWRAYRQMVEDQLRKASFVVTSPDDADLLAFFGYAIDQGREVVSTYSIPQYGVTGYSGGYTTGTITSYGGGYSTYSGTTTLTPTYGITGYTAGVSSDTVFTRSLSVDIVDKQTQNRRWEMKLRSQGSCGNIASVMPQFLQAAFDSFPGPSGKGRTVELPHDGTC